MNPLSLLRRVPVRAGNLELVCGEEFMLEKFCGFTFQISAESSFFQNIKAGEVLLKWVADFAKVNKNTTLIDIGCGVGTIGLLLAKVIYDINLSSKGAKLFSCSTYYLRDM